MKTYVFLRAILGCLLAQLESEDRAVGCAKLVLPGQGPFRINMEDEGQAWVRLVTTRPVTGVGQADQQPGNCGSVLGMTIEVGVMRCFPHTDNGAELDVDEVDEAAMVQLMDMESIYQAILCCDQLPKRDIILGEYTPLGPVGPDVGGFWTLEASPLW